MNKAKTHFALEDINYHFTLKDINPIHCSLLCRNHWINQHTPATELNILLHIGLFVYLHSCTYCIDVDLVRWQECYPAPNLGSSHMNQPLHKKVGEGCPPTTPPQPCCNSVPCGLSMTFFTLQFYFPWIFHSQLHNSMVI